MSVKTLAPAGMSERTARRWRGARFPSVAKVRFAYSPSSECGPNELMRYYPEHWDRATQTFVVFTGKGGRAQTIP